jgi:4-hydroxy-tetrahydrodipicolinate synthase
VNEGNLDKAYEMQALSDLYGNLYQSGRTLGESLWALKVLMKELRLCNSVVMPPLQPQSQEVDQQLIESLKSIQHKIS